MSEKVKKYIVDVLCIAAIALFYWLIMNPFFALHGMRDIPAIFAAFGLGAVACNMAFMKSAFLSVFIPAGYILGFISGALFNSVSIDSHGTAMSNFWIIWGCVYITVLVVGVILSRIRNRVKE